MTKKKKDTNNTYPNLIFTFRYICADFIADEDYYDEDDRKKIKHILQTITREIIIDKSYVSFKENKHEDTFMLEKGWKDLCKLVISTNYGHNATQKENDVMLESYAMMILCYIYLFFENLGYDSEGLCFSLTCKKKFMVEFTEDTINEWKYYPGKWQDWDSYKKK